ncbi:MAG: hypothetical protein QM820_06470 [Minicystis sp.]
MSGTETNRTTWDFLGDTYWYVTPPDLPALAFSPDDNVLTWRGDQTVWHISGVENGYFWGVTSVIAFDPDDADSKRAGRPRHLSLVGTVTAGGQVQNHLHPRQQALRIDHHRLWPDDEGG